MKKMAEIKVKVVEKNGMIDTKEYEMRGHGQLLASAILSLFFKFCDDAKVSPKELFEVAIDEREENLGKVRKNERNSRDTLKS